MAAGSPAAPSQPQKLDDLMLAMDVVDTLRHEERLVTRELDESAREAELVERLRSIYASQGLDVPDRIIHEGVKALKESRFVYEPPKPGFGRTMAYAWVNRGRWAKMALAAVVLVGGFFVAREVLVTGPERRAAEAQKIELSQTLPRGIDAALKEARSEAQIDTARARADQIAADGRAALARNDAAGAKKAVADLQALTAQLRQTYQLLIIARPGQPVGVFRVPDRNRGARNHYIIVDAIGGDGKPVSVPVTSEETNQTKSVSRWGVRVSEQTWQSVGRDRNDDGIIQRNKVGEKRRGFLDIDYAIPVTGGAILEW
ncbi:MAG: hypothetical protein K2Y29_04125 [Beijerinckiaceae bacterium]|nr:hypothetical protein [Beijerinckiaceae bacterium]